ncbi:hypothetical protein K491DRAFT_696745 [Lophiostoma macrostomum CBS 122681]|uniref:Uncharacterized protein n=1 Tax=Lophiostoma macrostomum CBS 122681 TaxID=1314788 RepID=A0A6A6SVS0_9PLEO|nr:hypothetical protein K491DRAFT_696745 [Lophiostoma macrostomum CBS 122681]
MLQHAKNERRGGIGGGDAPPMELTSPKDIPEDHSPRDGGQKEGPHSWDERMEHAQ